jgi:hypothetical protein
MKKRFSVRNKILILLVVSLLIIPSLIGVVMAAKGGNGGGGGGGKDKPPKGDDGGDSGTSFRDPGRKLQVTNTGIATRLTEPKSLGGDIVVHEPPAGTTIHYYRISTGQDTDTLIPKGDYATDGIRIAIRVSGNVSYYDINSGEIVVSPYKGYDPSPSGNLIAFESASTRTVQIWDTSDGSLTDTGVRGRDIMLKEGIVAFADPATEVIKFYNVATEVLTNTGVGKADTMSFDGTHVAFLDCTISCRYGESTIKYYNVHTGELFDTGVWGEWYPSIDGNVITFGTYEDLVGEDLNGNGQDLGDGVILFHTIDDGRTYNTGISGGCTCTAMVSGNHIIVDTDERWQNEDLNGDGDLLDDVLQIMELDSRFLS